MFGLFGRKPAALPPPPAPEDPNAPPHCPHLMSHPPPAVPSAPAIPEEPQEPPKAPEAPVEGPPSPPPKASKPGWFSSLFSSKPKAPAPTGPARPGCTSAARSRTSCSSGTAKSNAAAACCDFAGAHVSHQPLCHPQPPPPPCQLQALCHQHCQHQWPYPHQPHLHQHPHLLQHLPPRQPCKRLQLWPRPPPLSPARTTLEHLGTAATSASTFSTAPSSHEAPRFGGAVLIILYSRNWCWVVAVHTYIHIMYT